jgi:hypothetical protein
VAIQPGIPAIPHDALNGNFARHRMVKVDHVGFAGRGAGESSVIT